MYVYIICKCYIIHVYISLSFCLPKLSVPPLRHLSRLACLRVSHELKHSRLNPVVSAFAIYIMYIQYTYVYELT